MKEELQGSEYLHIDETGHKNQGKRGWSWVITNKALKLLKVTESRVSSTGSGVTLLHEAAFYGHVGVAELLIEHGATVDAKDRHNFTPLMYASAQGNSVMVELLLQKKADLYLQNNNGETALHSAADHGCFDTAFILISAAKDKEKYVNTQSRHVGTALHIIAYNREINEGHKKLTKLLLDNGTSPYLENDLIINAPQDTFWKGNSLSIAKKRGNKEFLELMASWGYSLTINDTPSNSNKSNTALQNTKGSKWPVIAASALAIAGIISGVAVAVYLEMLAVGIAVGACCLFAALIIYCCNRSSSSLEGSNVVPVDNGKLVEQQ
ncbi:ankyrin repeat domain protein [Trichonephila clavata]|uniref:Ankyrin repeat domain protein n=1 Tax=Trichonephila clavata TaxID=2740835 RepID=A0A8X6GRJ3_TRICU|nr:ankyrin repeat domain protein [Trichonephila clavata]